jgi:hypothetical protein
MKQKRTVYRRNGKMYGAGIIRDANRGMITVRMGTISLH